MFRRTYCRSVFFSPSPLRYSAFLYRQTFSPLFPDELLSFVQPGHTFARKLDHHAVTLFKNATSLEDIRAIYTSKELDKLIEQMIAEQCNTNPVSHDELINLSRMIIKWCARYRMHELGFSKALDEIHRDNWNKYGNPIGPTPSFLKQKYADNPKAVSSASKRFRSDEDMQKLSMRNETETNRGIRGN